MNRQGTLVRWEKDRRFGFIRCPDISADVFVHLRDFHDRGVNPVVGMSLVFEEIHVGGKGPRAVAVRAVGAAAFRAHEAHDMAPMHPARPTSRARPASPATRGNRTGSGQRRGGSGSTSSALPGAVFMVCYVALLGFGVWAGRVPLIAVGVLVLISLFTFFVYGFDKSAAENGRWRTAESTLHLLALLGGWPGAWCAQRLFHHKSRKTSFMVGYWTTVVAHFAAATAWIVRLPAGWPVL
ncbi:MAG: cold shock and DUF1294 domain-containing protein [Variovorax sp.]|nr:cold shock and DUF1294 domain-containing protein [Variovorax sp.]